MTPARSQLVLLLGTLLVMGLSLGLTILAGRSLPAEGFGRFALVAAVLVLAHELTDLGTGNLAARQAVRGPAAEAEALSWLLGLRLRLTALAGLAVAAYAVLQADPALRIALLAAVPVILAGHAGAFALVFQLRQAQLAPTLLHVAAQAAMLGGALVLAPLAAPWLAWALLLLAREAAQTGGVVLLARRLLRPLPRPRLGGLPGPGGLGAAATAVAIATLAFHLQVHGGVFALNALADPAALGDFAAAQRPILPGFVLPWLLALPLVPVLSHAATADRAAFRRQAGAMLDLAGGLGALAAVATAQLAAPLLALLFGGHLGDAAASATVLRLLGVAVGLTFPIAVLSPILLADRAERPLMLLSLTGLLGNLVLLLVLVPRLGAPGAAAAAAASLLLLALGGAAMAARRAGLRPGGRSLLVLAPAGLLWVLLPMLPGPPLLQLAAGGVLTLAAAVLLHALPSLRAARGEQAALALAARAPAHG